MPAWAIVLLVIWAVSLAVVLACCRTAPVESRPGQYGPVEAQNFGHGNGEKQ